MEGGLMRMDGMLRSPRADGKQKFPGVTGATLEKIQQLRIQDSQTLKGQLKRATRHALEKKGFYEARKQRMRGTRAKALSAEMELVAQ
eukprot:gene38917-37531_t